MIVLKDICKHYQEGGTTRTVLDHLSVTVNAGEFVALLGASGSGKSTLLNLIAGLDLPDSGVAKVGGEQICNMSERRRTLFRRKHIGFVFQFFSLIPTLTVAENICLGLELNQRERECDARVNYLLESIGLENRGASFPDRLSGGEQQRVAIARSVAHSPSLVLADEPTGNLDATTEARTLDLLDRIRKSENITLLAATHSPDVAKRADRVIQLESIQA